MDWPLLYCIMENISRFSFIKQRQLITYNLPTSPCIHILGEPLVTFWGDPHYCQDSYSYIWDCGFFFIHTSSKMNGRGYISFGECTGITGERCCHCCREEMAADSPASQMMLIFSALSFNIFLFVSLFAPMLNGYTAVRVLKLSSSILSN